MKLHIIAKAVGKEPGEVADAFQIERKQGFAMREIDDKQAQEYIVANSENTGKKRRVRFWSTKRSYSVPAGKGDVRGDIQCHDWTFECEDGSPEAAFLREHHDFFVAQGLYEVVEHPHEDPMMVADFIKALESVIYTGARGDNSPSREGRDCVKALLPRAASALMSSHERNVPRDLMKAVAKLVSLKVDTYGGTL